MRITNPEINNLQLEAIKLAESDNPPSLESLQKSLHIIEEALKMCEMTSVNDDSSIQSLLNNKAQVLRLMGRDLESLQCLNKIFSYPQVTSKTVLRQASAQRGWLHFRLGDNEAALRDFERAGMLGCLESKRMAVRCNPYSAMCNQMIHEIIGSTFYTK